MADITLPISRLINVDVVLTPQAAQAQDLSTLLVLGNSDVINTFERIRTYTSLDAVAADFGTTAPEYKCAVLWFEQAPQPTALKIGRWAKTATSGLLVGASLSVAEQLIATWNAITTGTFTITVDAATPVNITGLNFAAAANMNGVAAVIDTALNSHGASCVWDAVNKRFEIQSDSTGPTSTVSFLGTVGSGVDVSDDLKMRSTSSGAYLVSGIALETAVAAVAIFDAYFGQTWYAVTVPEVATDQASVDVAEYIQGSNNKHLYGVSTQEAGVISSVSTSDIAYLLHALDYSRSVVEYSSSNAYSVCSLLGRILTVDYNGNSTVIDLMYKQEPGIVPETLTETQLLAATNKASNVFVKYNNDTAIIERGDSSSGDPLDIITGTDWLAVTIMTAVYNLLYTSPTKIPQTDSGVQQIVNTINSVCSQGVVNGLLAPGVWNSNGFGSLKSGQFLDAGFYVYAPPVGSQSQAAREARQSPTIQVAAKLAGAVRTVDIIINVNR